MADVDKKELVFESVEEFKKSLYGDSDKDASYWRRQNRPVLWVKEYEDEHVKAYIDAAYGKLKLVIGEEEDISNIGNCLVFKDYILLSEYYGEAR